MRYAKLMLGITLLLAVVFSLSSRPAYAGVYGPNWTATPFRAYVSNSSFYMIDTETPAPTNAYNWIDCDSYNGGTTTQIDSAQTTVSNQIWLSPIKILFGFDFPYFGTTYNGVYVSLHGWCSFENPGNPRSSANAVPTNLPIDQAPYDNFIAVYWDQLFQTLSQGQVFYKQISSPSNGLVVEWVDVMYDTGLASQSLVFQVIFWENGDINFNYSSFTSTIYGNGSSATIGLRSGEQFVEYTHNTPTISYPGYGIYFTYSEPNLPPDVAIGANNITSADVFPSVSTPTAVLQFSLTPSNCEGTVYAVSVIVQGPKPSSGDLQPQSFGVYIVRDLDGNGFKDSEDPVVSGIDGSGDPLYWNPWADGAYYTPVLMFDSLLTSDLDNEMLFNEGNSGTKNYLVMAVWNNLVSLDEYKIGIAQLLLSGTYYDNLSPTVVNLVGTTLTVQDLDPIDVQGPYTYPPAPEQDIDVLAENVVALSFSVAPSADFPSQLVALGLTKAGTGQGMYVGARVYADYGERGIYEPGTDIDVTADGWLSTTTSTSGYALSEGNPSGVFYIFLTTPPDPDNPQGYHTYLGQGSGARNFLVLCTFYQSLSNEGDTYRLSLEELYYNGGPGSPYVLDNPIDGSVLRLVAPDEDLGVVDTPYTSVSDSLSAVPGGSNMTVGRFSFRPYNRDGVLHQFTLTAAGSGDDVSDISDLKVVLDENMNGIYDTQDTLYFQGTWPEDNGNIVIELLSKHQTFNAWDGGTTEDYANMNHFILVYNFASTVQYGETFSYSVSEIQYTYSGMDRTTLPTNWGSPVVTIQDIVESDVTAEASTFTSVRERFLVPTGTNTTNLEMAVVKVTAGSSAIRISSFTLETSCGGYTGDGNEAVAIDQIWMYPDKNLNGSFETADGETLSWLGSPTSRPFLYNDGTATIFVLEPNYGENSPYYLPANQTIHWRIFFTFNSDTVPGSGFMANVTSMSFEASVGGQYISQPAISLDVEGGRKEAIGSVIDGGSITISKGPALATGASKFVLPGNFIEVNQFKLYCGNSESVRVNFMDFHYYGSANIWDPDTTNVIGDDLNSVYLYLDNGDGVVDMSYDIQLSGTVSGNQAYDVITFTPSAASPLVLPNGTTSYIVVAYIVETADVAIGATLSCYIAPEDVNVTGGNASAGWTPRYVGADVYRFGNEVYGWKAVVGTSYDTGGYTGSDATSGDASADNGNPWSTGGYNPADGGGGGCFVATASFGSLSADAVSRLCSVRDEGLNTSSYGNNLVELYYAVSPDMAGSLAGSNATRALLRSLLSK